MTIAIINDQIPKDLKKSIITSANHHCQCKKHLHTDCNIGVNMSSYFIADSKTTRFTENSVKVFCHSCVHKFYHHSDLKLPILTNPMDSKKQKE